MTFVKIELFCRNVTLFKIVLRNKINEWGLYISVVLFIKL